ncbi:AAA-ATPase Vps4-associated protein 1-domain-containing protein [Syncephalis fuscata]|nr:AAA-ATPase Vps4-associated protein 1-domain-containing protein [Syncephalis fuscata]
MSLVNEYIGRTAKDEASCFICHRITTSVLTSTKSKPVDWFYCCLGHLKDTGFCKKQTPEAVNSSASSTAETETANKESEKKEKLPEPLKSPATSEKRIEYFLLKRKSFGRSSTRYKYTKDNESTA